MQLSSSSIKATQRRAKLLISALCLCVRKLILTLPKSTVQNLGLDLQQQGAASHRGTDADEYFLHALIDLVLRWGEMAQSAGRRGEKLSHSESKAGEAYAVYCVRAAQETEQAPDGESGVMGKFAAVCDHLPIKAKIPTSKNPLKGETIREKRDRSSHTQAQLLRESLREQKVPAEVMANIDEVVRFLGRELP